MCNSRRPRCPAPLKGIQVTAQTGRTGTPTLIVAATTGDLKNTAQVAVVNHRPIAEGMRTPDGGTTGRKVTHGGTIVRNPIKSDVVNSPVPPEPTTSLINRIPPMPLNAGTTATGGTTEIVT